MAVNTVPTSVKKKPRGASRKGIPNKVTKELKEMILGALDDAGGQKYLAAQAIENPSAFMTLIGKVLPKDVNVGGQSDNPIKVSKIELVPLK
ncbi:MAG: hypothetical protein ACXV8I_11675 [Methylobacter sp.]